MVLGVFALVFVIFLFPALMQARREARDGIRRNEIAAFKIVLEQYYNEHGTYPLAFDATPHEYRIVARDAYGAQAWYLRALLENSHVAQAGYDGDEGRKFDFRYVREDEATYYEVCGGTPTCDLDDPRQ